MKGSEARKRIYKSLCASFLAFVMILTNVLGAVEVYAADGIEAPTITKAFIGTNTISGGKLHRGSIGGKQARGTVHVTLKDSSGNEKATVSVTPKSGTTWTVNLPEGVKIAEGDTVTAYQEFNGSNSEPVTVNAMDSLAKQNKDKLQMPSGEIYIEQTSSNQVNEDEQAEAVELFNNANTAIAGDIKLVKFSIDTAEHAYYEVTYTDGSTSGKVEATNLKIKQVTEHSRGATLGSITIVDNVIKGQLSGEGPFDGIKVQILLKLSDAVKDSYCDGGKCLVDKDTSKPVDATVNGETGEFTYTIPNPDLKLDQKVGVTVKEPHKFKSCSQTTVKPVKVDKIEVKDPRKLTADDKKAIDAAIRKGYTVNGESKLPNGTGDWDGVPAVIQIDDSGNVKIFSGNDVAGTWDENYKFVPETNEDGSYKLKDGAEPKITIPAKDLLKNLKPDAPKVDLSGDKKSITITPNLKVDTDANSISVSYTGKDGSTKTTTATKGDSGWTIEGEGSVDQNGVITLPKDKVKGDTTVTATVTDKGGIAEGDTDPLTSDSGTLTVEETKAEKVEALGGLDPKDIKKWVGDDVNWKDGIKAKESTKETEVNKLLEGATFEDATDTARKTDSAGTRAGKIKVKFDDNSELVVDNQTLYVSNHVTNKDAQNLPDDALEVEFQLGEGTKVNNVGSGAIEGKKDTPTLYQKYKVKPNTNLKDYKLPTINQSVVDSIKLSAQEGYVEPVWNTEDFTATKTNKIFTATATKAYNVTLEANGGDGNMAGAQVKENGTYKLPDNAFTPPNENQEFAGWLVNGATTVTKPGTDITITKDTVIKASWKPIEFKAEFLPGEGATGSMEEKTVTKGSEFELPTPTFTAPKDKVFAGWKVPGEAKVKKAGDKIGISGDVTLTATWKDIEYKVTFNGNEGTGTMTEATVKKGEKYKLPDNSFGAPSDKQEFKTWEVDGKEVAPGTEITVDKDTEVKAVWKDIEYKVTFNGNEGTGSMDTATVKKGEKYKLPDNSFGAPSDKQEFKTWEVDGKEVAPETEITVDKDTEVKAIWKDIEYKVTFNGNEGTGTMTGATVKKGEKYKLPDNSFGAPSDKQEFKTWEVDGKEVAPETEITVDKDTEVKAIWKDIEYKVTFNGTEGTGTMPEKLVKKGDKYTLPENGFEAPKDKVFDGWMVGTDKKSAGDTITVNGDTEVKAVWKAKPVVPTPNPGGGEEPTPQPPTPNPNPEQPQTIAAPKVTVDTKTGNLIITPPVGKDIKSVTVNYQDPTGAKKTAVAEKSADGWSLIPATTNGETVDKVTGVITIPKGKYKLEEVVKAFANNQVNQQSKEANATPVEVSYDVNGGSKGVESAITIKGESYVLPAIYKLPEYLLTVPQGKEFAGWEVDGQTMKAGESIKVNKNTVVKAIWKAKLVEPSKPDAPAVDRGDYLILEKVEPTEPKVDWEIGRHYKYLYGYPDGSVHPEGQITRAEAAGLIARLAELDLSNKAKPNFKDTPSRWYNSAINVMVAKDLMFADKNGNFRPNEPITRGEFARALYYIDKKNNVVAPFADVKGHEFEAAINQAYGNGRIAGYPDGSFRPDAYIQRAEAARMLNQYADRSVSLEGMAGVKKDVIRFTDINESHWAYYEVMEAANTHDYRRAKGTLPETWVRIIQKDDRVAR